MKYKGMGQTGSWLQKKCPEMGQSRSGVKQKDEVL
jgi:hypothetical protein